jgi:hypothetical protein
MRSAFLVLAILSGAASTAVAAEPGVAPNNAVASVHRGDTAGPCTVQARNKKLTGHARTAFLKSCQQGALATTKPTYGAHASASAKVLTAPSGADRNTRSAQCSAEAVRRHLPEIQAKEFRLSCLATAGPVQEGEDQTQAPKPSPAKPGLDTLPRPHRD